MGRKNCGGTTGIIIGSAWDKKSHGFSVWPDKFNDSVSASWNLFKFIKIQYFFSRFHKDFTNFQ